jgi:PKD repeat protein
LKVRFDASQSILNIPGDEIIYFSWDFGDGETRPNFSNGVIEHTYTYDRQKESGFYSPKVVLTTKKGYSLEVKAVSQISVKKQLVQVELTSPSHPQSQAKTGVNVKFFADFNGLPETMKWDFGDGSTPVQCKGRTCSEIDHTFEKVGRYTVKLSLILEDLQSVDALLPFNVY